MATVASTLVQANPSYFVASKAWAKRGVCHATGRLVDAGVKVMGMGSVPRRNAHLARDTNGVRSSSRDCANNCCVDTALNEYTPGVCMPPPPRPCPHTHTHTRTHAHAPVGVDCDLAATVMSKANATRGWSLFGRHAWRVVSVGSPCCDTPPLSEATARCVCLVHARVPTHARICACT